MRFLELRRHTDNDGDRLTEQGVADAEEIGRSGLNAPYAAFVSSGAQRATQMVEILRRAAGQEDVALTEATGLRSDVEDQWRAVAKEAGSGADLDDMRRIDPDLVERESAALSVALREIIGDLELDARALAIGHSPPTRPPCSASSASSLPPSARVKAS